MACNLNDYSAIMRLLIIAIEKQRSYGFAWVDD